MNAEAKSEVGAYGPGNARDVRLGFWLLFDWIKQIPECYAIPYGFLMAFSILSVLAGGTGVVVYFYADVSAWWLVMSLLVIVYGGMLFWSGILSHDITARMVVVSSAFVKGLYEEKEKEILAQAEKDVSAQQKTTEARVAKKQKEIDELKNDKSRMESEGKKLTYTLHGVQETLAYYSANERLDVYDGDDALRECGGIYVIKNAGDGRVKIGVTDDNFKRRFGEIQSHCASAGIKKDDVLPVILVPLDEGKYEVEREIHHALAENKTAGEWFDVTPEEAVAAVLQHVRDKRVANYKERSKIPVGKNGER